jgi:hypothetical protein
MKTYRDKDRLWNRCDICGKLISMADFESGKAQRRMVTPDTAFSSEDYETLCRNHARKGLDLSGETA